MTTPENSDDQLVDSHAYNRPPPSGVVSGSSSSGGLEDSLVDNDAYDRLQHFDADPNSLPSRGLEDSLAGDNAYSKLQPSAAVPEPSSPGGLEDSLTDNYAYNNPEPGIVAEENPSYGLNVGPEPGIVAEENPSYGLNVGPEPAHSSGVVTNPSPSGGLEDSLTDNYAYNKPPPGAVPGSSSSGGLEDSLTDNYAYNKPPPGAVPGPSSPRGLEDSMIENNAYNNPQGAGAEHNLGPSLDEPIYDQFHWAYADTEGQSQDVSAPQSPRYVDSVPPDLPPRGTLDRPSAERLGFPKDPLPVLGGKKRSDWRRGAIKFNRSENLGNSPTSVGPRENSPSGINVHRDGDPPMPAASGGGLLNFGSEPGANGDSLVEYNRPLLHDMTQQLDQNLQRQQQNLAERDSIDTSFASTSQGLTEDARHGEAQHQRQRAVEILEVTQRAVNHLRRAIDENAVMDDGVAREFPH